jgi:hypothetical protein
VIPLVLIGYAVFLWIDKDLNDDPALKGHIRHIQNIRNGSSIEGLVFGGSNGVYSLSAQLLSSQFGIRWYNASVKNEMHTVKRYNDFIGDLANSIDRTKVKYVIYSSQLPYVLGNIAEHSSTKVEKVDGLGIKPKKNPLRYIFGIEAKMSIRAYIKSLKRPKKPNPEHLDEFGDLVFKNFRCEYKKQPNPQREKEDISADFLAKQAVFLGSIFPYASIFIVLPSEYYGGKAFDDRVWQQNLQSKFYHVLSQKHQLKDAAVKIIVQPPYLSAAQICNGQEHANEQGRIWRTRNLIDFIGPRLLSQR